MICAGFSHRLYYIPWFRAVIAQWMLDECGADYEIVRVDFAKREHKTPDRPKLEDDFDRLLARPKTMKIGG
ncbi:MAG: hypothetical protein U1E51_32605 [Candidatus Binatia bacterium]|nr:hypothetical protein [Candidatus Binatia bacterium]